MEVARRGHALLSDEQIARADAVYETEKISTLDVLHDSIARAVGPFHGCCVALTRARYALMEFAEVINSPSQSYLLPGGQCLQRRAACLFDLSRVSVRVGQHHHGEEVTAQKCRVIDGPDAAARIRGCLSGRPRSRRH